MQGNILQGSKERKAAGGSYGWGDGQWMRDWEERCNDAGTVLATAPVMANESPDEDALNECRDLGKALS